MSESASCPDCGALGVDGRRGCLDAFNAVIAREFREASLFAIHNLTVDAYSLQHPERFMNSAKSYAAHLAGMCWYLEFGAANDTGRAISRWLNGSKKLDKGPAPKPRQRGELTILHVRDAVALREHRQRVEEWARTVWHAWRAQHAQARTWAREVSERTIP